MAKRKEYAPIGFFDRYRELRAKINLTDKQLAELLGGERKRFIGYKNGSVMPPITVCDYICRASGESLNYLIRGEK